MLAQTRNSVPVPSARMMRDRPKHLETVFLCTLGQLTILQNFEYHESFSQLSIHLIVVANLRHNCVTPKCCVQATLFNKNAGCAQHFIKLIKEVTNY